MVYTHGRNGSKLTKQSIFNLGVEVAENNFIPKKILQTKKTLIFFKALFFKIYDLKSEIIMQAAEKKTKDYEDALQMVTAQKLKASFIVTRNIKDFTGSKIIAVKPSELLERVDF